MRRKSKKVKLMKSFRFLGRTVKNPRQTGRGLRKQDVKASLREVMIVG